MTYKKEIKHLAKSITDHLKDAQMLFDYAKEAKLNNNSELANYFISKVKIRLQMLNEDHQRVKDLIKKEETENKQMSEEGKWDCLHEHLINQKTELDFLVQNFKL